MRRMFQVDPHPSRPLVPRQPPSAVNRNQHLTHACLQTATLPSTHDRPAHHGWRAQLHGLHGPPATIATIAIARTARPQSGPVCLCPWRAQCALCPLCSASSSPITEPHSRQAIRHSGANAPVVRARVSASPPAVCRGATQLDGRCSLYIRILPRHRGQHKTAANHRISQHATRGK